MQGNQQNVNQDYQYGKKSYYQARMPVNPNQASSQGHSKMGPTSSLGQTVFSTAPTLTQQLQHTGSSNPMVSPPLSMMQTQSSLDQLNEYSQRNENTARLCRIGQVLVQEIVSKALEVFNILKSTQLPNHIPTNQASFNERKRSIHDHMKQILDYFKKLKQTHKMVQENSSKMDLVPVENLIPFEGEDNPDCQIQKSENYHQILAEHSALQEQLRGKNEHLKEVIDQMRNLLWELNSMTAINNARP